MANRNKYQQLQDLERRANKLANNACFYGRFEETNEKYNSHLSICRRKWDKLIEELRGWGDWQGDQVTKQEWKDYCEKHGLAVGYNFGDVMA